MKILFDYRVLMFMWIGAFIVMVTINLLMALFDLAAGHFNPQKISETGQFFDFEFDISFYHPLGHVPTRKFYVQA